MDRIDHRGGPSSLPSRRQRTEAVSIPPTDGGARAYKGRVTAIYLFIMALGIGVGMRAASIQVWKDERLDRMARRQFESKVLLSPRRGMITDRSGEPLAVNTDVQSLAANPSKIPNPRTLARRLSDIVGVPESTLRARLMGKKSFVWLKRHLTEQELKGLRRRGVIDVEGEPISGFYLVKETRRNYPHGELAAHIMGSVNLDSQGIEGVEMWQDEKLRGRVASVDAVRDALGRPAFLDSVAARELEDGEDVSLTLDASLQFAVEHELKAAVERTGSRSGSVIVMDSRTGEILAMANEPSFNANEKNVPFARRRNRAVTDGYEPGSTFKPLILAGALQRNWKLTDRLNGERGSFVVQGHRISEAEAHEKFESISLKKMIQVSSNVVSAKLAMKLGSQAIGETLRQFGFGTRTGTAFPGEISGRIPAVGPLQPIRLANLGFGHGVLVTPIQMVRAYAAIANGGILVQPHLLKNSVGTAAARRIFTEKVATDVTEALLGVTAEGGTGIKAGVSGYAVAGKTGTAQVVDPDTGRYSRSRYIASFVGFAARTPNPHVILTVLHEPKGIYYASETAAPLFSAVLRSVASRFSIPADPSLIPEVVAERIERARTAIPEHDVVRVSAARALDALQSAPPERDKLEWAGVSGGGAQQWRMPRLQGLSAREALGALAGHSFRVEVSGVGVVREQSPGEGTAIAEGAKIRMILGRP